MSVDTTSGQHELKMHKKVSDDINESRKRQIVQAYADLGSLITARMAALTSDLNTAVVTDDFLMAVSVKLQKIQLLTRIYLDGLEIDKREAAAIAEGKAWVDSLSSAAKVAYNLQ